MAAPPRSGEGVAVERAVAEVSTAAIERNCRRLRDEIGRGTEMCAVVKAGAYGHGLASCARAARAGGAGWLAVACAEEAAELRVHEPDARILVMGALTPADVDSALATGADVAAWDMDFLELLGARAGASGARPRVHVKVDTGMGRLGTRDPEEAVRLVEACAADPRLELAGLWTHLATADEPNDNGYFEKQLAAFAAVAERVRASHPDVILHAANSAATLRDSASHFDMVRCGIAVYGLDPFHRDAASQGLEPALELRSYVAAVKRFERGASAGYGRSWRAPDATWVGVVPIGYGDGVRRALSNNADVLVGGVRRPIVGTISMDNLTVDLGADTDVRPGADAVLIGAQNGERIACEEVAERLGTITYEVTCGLSPRVRRRSVP